MPGPKITHPCSELLLNTLGLNSSADGDTAHLLLVTIFMNAAIQTSHGFYQTYRTYCMTRMTLTCFRLSVSTTLLNQRVFPLKPFEQLHSDWDSVLQTTSLSKPHLRSVLLKYAISKMLLPAVASASRGTKTQSETKIFMLAARRPLVASLAIYTGLRRSEGASKRVVLQTGLHGGGWCRRCQKRVQSSS